jgi:hypothetical protein
VSIGGTGATGVTVANSTSIGATTPVHTAGAVSVVVTNTDRQSGALANGYTYTSSLGLRVPTGDPNSATVIAGQAASYTLSLGGAGTSGSAAVSCTGAPTGANCAVPASETFSANVPVTFSVTVRTTSRTIGALHPPASAPTPGSWPLAMTMLGIVVLPGTRSKRSVRRYLWLAPLTLSLFLASCGGGGSAATGGQEPNPNGTPVGTYTLTVNATSGSTTEATSLTLAVQ